MLISPTQPFKESLAPFPPSPPREPILGHYRKLPLENAHLKHLEYVRKYNSDIVYFNVFGNHMIVLRWQKFANEILDKRGANYMDRPRFVLFDVMGWGLTLTFTPYGPRFKLPRSALQTNFIKSAIVNYRPIQEDEARQAVARILRKPADWDKSLRRFASAIVLRIGFGVVVKSNDDPYIEIATNANLATYPGTTLVDYMPIFQSTENEKAGVPNEMDMADIQGATASVFIAGSNTTLATTTVAVLNMVMNPYVFRKAREEIDSVVGLERLPTLADRAALRYIDYLVEETTGWRPLSPIGIPHKSLQDDVYEGMFMPKGTYVYYNTYAMSRDPSVYKDPESFNPDRYTPKEEGGDGEPFLVGPFGFGRRICVGRHLAQASVWIIMATFIATMELEMRVGVDGKPIEQNREDSAKIASRAL
ncbi:cytochrome P450 [Clohesyomyces aquaticus]|uniref:Cytochrome P450 n=1 Tax=Clohesyomyces aquaticus TaxID=1231657 RepID=A0A1Y1YEX1_9PLEO|nr:cytochrome P450 [Clohesyomyces aquaticus]